jgi:hypothetical protein
MEISEDSETEGDLEMIFLISDELFIANFFLQNKHSIKHSTLMSWNFYRGSPVEPNQMFYPKVDLIHYKARYLT